MTKVCKDCGEVRNLEEFYQMQKMADGLHYYCVYCMRKRSSSWRKDNKEKFALQQERRSARGYHEEYRSRPEVKEATAKRSREWAKNNPAKRVANEQKRRAAKLAGGVYTDKEWTNLCDNYKNCCLGCGSEDSLTVDHVVPLSLGGLNTIDNIQPLCRPCNSRKRNKIIDYRKGE